MRLLTLFGVSSHVTLRVTSESGPAIFDAVVLFDRQRGFETKSFSGQQTPFETELSDADVTIVVRPRDASRPVVAEYEVTVAGKRRLWSRSSHGMPILRRRGGGVIGAGMADSDAPGAGGAAEGALAIR
jgi:hypothetical protein